MIKNIHAAVRLLNSHRLIRSGTGPRNLVLMDLPQDITAAELQEAYDLVTAAGSPYAERPEDVSYYWVVTPEQRERLFNGGRQDRLAIRICEDVLAWCKVHRRVAVPQDAFLGIVSGVEAADRNRQAALEGLPGLMFGDGDGEGLLTKLLSGLEAAGLMKAGTSAKLIEYGRANPGLIGNLFSYFSEGITQSGQRIFDEELDVRGIYLTFKPKSDVFSSLFDLIEMTAALCDDPECAIHHGRRGGFGFGGRHGH